MGNALFLHPYFSDLATVSASSAASGLPASNVQTADPSQKWRSTSGSGSSLDFDFGSGGFAATAAALIGTNLSATATWFIGASNSSIANARAGGGMIAANNTSPWVGAKTTKPGWAQHIALARWANAVPYRYWSVVFTDASLTYMEWAKENFGANRLNPKRHEFIVDDCFSALAGLANQGKRYDVILMDPPSFSTTAKSRFTTRGGTSGLVAAALPLLPTWGLLITSSNHQKVDVADYLKELRRGALQAGSELRVISLAGQPEDFPYPVTFPEGRYLKYAICVKD